MAPSNEEKKDNASESKQLLVADAHDDKRNNNNNSNNKSFTFAQMVDATQNFNPDNFLGEGGFGKVYKGRLEDSDQVCELCSM